MDHYESHVLKNIFQMSRVIKIAEAVTATASLSAEVVSSVPLALHEKTGA